MKLAGAAAGPLSRPASRAPARWSACGRGSAPSSAAAPRRRSSPSSRSAWNVALCQAAPLRSVTQRRSMIPSSRSRSPGSTPQRSRPSWASGSSRRRTSSAAGHLADAGPVDVRVDPLPGAGVEVLLGGGERHPRPHRPLVLGQHPDAGRSRRRRWPAMSTTVGPAGSTRFSTRRCGLPRTTS